MPQELINVYIELLITLKNILIPITVFLCILIGVTILTKIALTATKLENNDKIAEEEIKLLKEKYSKEK